MTLPSHTRCPGRKKNKGRQHTKRSYFDVEEIFFLEKKICVKKKLFELGRVTDDPESCVKVSFLKRTFRDLFKSSGLDKNGCFTCKKS